MTHPVVEAFNPRAVRPDLKGPVLKGPVLKGPDLTSPARIGLFCGHRQALFALMAGLLASGCRDPEPVPFGLVPPDRVGNRDPAPEIAAGHHNPEQAAAGGLVQPLGRGIRAVSIEGAHLSFDGEGCVLWTGDVDDDGDRDSILLRSSDGHTELLYAIHTRDQFESWVSLIQVSHEGEDSNSPSPLAGCCEGAVMEMLGPRVMHVLVRGCGSETRTHHVLLELTGRPRILAELTLTKELPLEFRLLHEADGPQHPDVIASPEVNESLELRWENRASGFIYDATHFEKTVSALLEPEWKALRTASDSSRPRIREALTTARMVRQVADAVCATSSLKCVPSSAAGEASALEAESLARLGSVGQAVRGYEALYGREVRTRMRHRRRVREAIVANGIPLSPIRRGPPLAERSGAGRLSPLAFLDETRLLIRTSPARVWNLESDQVVEIEPDQRTSRVITDSQRQHQVFGVTARCDGFTVLQVGPRSGALGHHGPEGSWEVRLDGSPARCHGSEASRAHRSTDGSRTNGWLLLGWAPQGMLADRFGELRLVPLTAAATQADAARTLRPGSPAPAPVQAGAMDRSGAHYLVPTRLGLLLRSRRARKLRLILPDGWQEEEDAHAATAVSPSGNRLATTLSGTVVVFDAAGEHRNSD